MKSLGYLKDHDLLVGISIQASSSIQNQDQVIQSLQGTDGQLMTGEARLRVGEGPQKNPGFIRSRQLPFSIRGGGLSSGTSFLDFP